MNNPRIPPHSLEAETSVLGAILISKEGITKVAEFLRPEHFYDPAHQSIYQAILELYERREPLDIVTLAEQLKKSRKLSAVGGASILAELTDSVPTASHIEHYGRLVKDNWLKRQLIETAAQANELAFNQSRPTGEIFDEVEQKIFALSQQEDRRGFISVKDALAESFDRLDELQRTQTGLRGVPSGFKDLDNALAGMQPSNLLILAARPGIGKTTLALNISQYAAVTAGIPVGYFALEMSQEEMVDRMLIAQADVDAWKFKTGRFSEADFNRLSEAFGILAEAPMFIDDTPALSVMEMRTKARRLKAEHNVGLLIVDYLQLARSRNLENRVQEVSEISQGLKNLARELKTPILALSQLSRAVEHRGHSRPQLADLRECLTADTEIVNADTGEIWKIKDIAADKTPFPVFAINKDGKIIRTLATEAFQNGVKKVYLMTTRSGRKIRASANHPLLRLDGWVRLDNLAVGDRIAVPRQLPVSALERPLDFANLSQVRLLAHMIGDGCYLPRHVLQYTSTDPACLELVMQDAAAAFPVNVRCVAERQWHQVYITSRQPVSRRHRNPMVEWLEELEIWGQRSPDKIIPAPVFLLPQADVKLFLKHIWATDGCVSVRDSGRVTIFYVSASRKLADQIRHLLLRCGILSVIRENRKPGYRVIYQVHVSGAGSQRLFLKMVGGFGEKSKDVKDAVLALTETKENLNVDIIPREAWKIIDEVRRDYGISWRMFAQKLGMSYCGSALFKTGISRERMARIHRFLDDPRISNLAESDIFWDEVVSIAPQGEEPVYDLKVEGVHNFIANDIFAHNSGAIEQDADVVMFLYRENEDDRENVTLDIQKHRNGPLRKLNLFFKGDRIRFFSVDRKQAAIKPAASAKISASKTDKSKKSD